MLEYVKNHKVFVAVIIITVGLAIFQLAVLFKKVTPPKTYFDEYIAAKDSVIAVTNRFITAQNVLLAEKDKSILYFQGRDSLLILSITSKLQVDKQLEKQQRDVKTFINNLGRNTDSIRRAFSNF
jgi:hypothetical protein